MKAIRRKFIAVLMLFALMIGNSVHADHEFFWSDIEPRPSCTSISRDGTKGNLGLVIDGKKIDLDLPSCDEAMKNHVSVFVEGKYLHVVARIIVMHIGKQEMLVDGSKVSLEGIAPMIRGNVTFLPVRQLAETLGIKVDWSSEKRTATFTQE
ncbi:copper amine oxidase N-terminal domain-containing protein [Paenibacillus sp. GCM10028914]|uniref:copper amine oxidase N-terminal domain-containing protein n=1 Tax=Paenibacillus sp. GCM10028914 TaxID=3273416 RepID=UPI003605E24D